MSPKGNRSIHGNGMETALALGSDFILNHQGNALPHLARRLGLTTQGLRYYVSNEGELIRLLCQRHLNEAFDAVCIPTDWCGTPTEVLRAMSLALLRLTMEKPSRHRVFLLHRHGLDEPARNADDTALTYLTNNFQLALHDVQPDSLFDALHSPARMLLGQLLYLPLWWPAEPHVTQDEWLCLLIGQLTGTPPPDWRMPAASRSHSDDALDRWGERRYADPPGHVTA